MECYNYWTTRYSLVCAFSSLICFMILFQEFILFYFICGFCFNSDVVFDEMGSTAKISEGGFFNAIMSFPSNYPNSPPTVKFTTEIWHPNVYPDGRVCISILHPPGDDPNGYELASERWMPVHTVESIVLSIISMLSSPNDESPANVEAAKEWRESRDDFKKKVSRCVRKSQETL
ncbi:ubiquitin-conjugating enzyme E2 13-like isoform X3 [Mangifera indica]|uniref:ubiquitin-conjugating enzyme E2 13-like isoform X3 n=1 Tax=Mangifera indica TaxID=29780 RepID=UPI001CFA018A|nr:ubiquitin-conjugating enzyme E2 13-like isoform X3 [Mangifera indica]